MVSHVCLWSILGHQTHFKVCTQLTSMYPPIHVWLAIIWSCIKPWGVLCMRLILHLVLNIDVQCTTRDLWRHNIYIKLYLWDRKRTVIIFCQRMLLIQAYRHCLVATTGKIMINRTFGSPSFHDILPAHAKHTLTLILTVLVHDMW